MSQPAILEMHPAIDPSRPTCLSGGAKGADHEWGTAATVLGHDVKHWSFPTHDQLDPSIPDSQVVRLTDDELDLHEISATIQAAAMALSLQPPSNLHARRLIQRIYYQVAWAESCYDITSLGVDPVTGKKLAGGGTMWALSMFRLLRPESARCFVNDQTKGQWSRVSGLREEDWEVMNADPPRPTGVWAGVGSRTLCSNGKEAIWALLSAG